MIPYFGQEINSGVQAGNAATEKAFANLGNIGNVIAEANRAYGQRKYNSRLEELQAARAQIPGTDTAALEQNYRQLRDLDTMGHVRGLRTVLTPENYLQMDMLKEKLAADAIQDQLKKQAAAEQEQLKQQAAAQAEKEKREQGVIDKFDDYDKQSFNTLYEFDRHKKLSPESRETLLNAIIKDDSGRFANARVQLLGELSKEQQNELRDEIIRISETESTQFKNELKKALGGNSSASKLLDVIPAVVASSVAGGNIDAGTQARIEAAIAKKFNGITDEKIIRKNMNRYTLEQLKAGRKIAEQLYMAMEEGNVEDW